MDNRAAKPGGIFYYVLKDKRHRNVGLGKALLCLVGVAGVAHATGYARVVSDVTFSVVTSLCAMPTSLAVPATGTTFPLWAWLGNFTLEFLLGEVATWATYALSGMVGVARSAGVGHNARQSHNAHKVGRCGRSRPRSSRGHGWAWGRS